MNMQKIQSPSNNTLKMLGKPQVSDNGYRWMTYVAAAPIEDGVLVFHLLTRELLLLTEDEYAHPDNIAYLHNQWFWVPEEMVDQEQADLVRFVRKSMQKRAKNITGYTIFTTTDCNARCFYCYEMGRSRVSMNKETAYKTADYIAGHCGDEKVKLHWFGGEPLFNQSVMDTICHELKEKGIEYTSSMTTNGYLFDRETVDQAVNLWKVKWVQITLDGTEKVYNRSKAYIYENSVSPYQIVIANINTLLDADIHVSIRMNMDNYNAEDLMRLADELYERFGGNKCLNGYSHVLFEFAGNKERIREDEGRRSLYEKQKLLRRKLKQYGFWARVGIDKNMPVNHCMADGGKAVTILPNGEIGLCEHYSEDNFIGHIDSDELDSTVIESFRETLDAIEECRQCLCYPECIRLKKCPEQRICFPEIREDKKQVVFDKMKVTYDAWLKKEESDGEKSVPIC